MDDERPLEPYANDNPPQAYKEQFEPHEKPAPDPGDEVLPRGRGFVTDLVFAQRGYEIPTLFTVWTALVTLSSVIKRDAWIKWGRESKLFANLYAVICGPAGVVKKSTALNYSKKLLHDFPRYLTEETFKRIKTLTVISDKFTPEALIASMAPSSKNIPPKFVMKDAFGNPLKKPDGTDYTYERTSESTILLPEMSISIGKQDYSTGIIETLIGLYDHEETFSKTTMGGGQIQLKNVFTNFLAATTPGAFKTSMPRSTLSDGFLSRTTIVHQADTERIYTVPWTPEHSPTTAELSRRLAWIARNTLGTFDLSEEARRWMDGWYARFKENQKKDHLLQGAKSRMDVIMYRLAFLIRAQRYDNYNRVITKQDVIDANRILVYTFRDSMPLYRVLLGGRFNEEFERIERYVKTHKKVMRKSLLQNTRSTADGVDVALSQLIQEDKIGIIREGQESKKPVRNQRPFKKTGETYVWLDQNGTDPGVKEDDLYLPTVDYDPEQP